MGLRNLAENACQFSVSPDRERMSSRRTASSTSAKSSASATTSGVSGGSYCPPKSRDRWRAYFLHLRVDGGRSRAGDAGGRALADRVDVSIETADVDETIGDRGRGVDRCFGREVPALLPRLEVEGV